MAEPNYLDVGFDPYLNRSIGDGGLGATSSQLRNNLVIDSEGSGAPAGSYLRFLKKVTIRQTFNTGGFSGGISLPHGLGYSPAFAIVRMKSDGQSYVPSWVELPTYTPATISSGGYTRIVFDHYISVARIDDTQVLLQADIPSTSFFASATRYMLFDVYLFELSAS